MHVHVSALEAITVFAYVVIIGALWRWGAARLAERSGNLKAVGEAMAVIY